MDRDRLGAVHVARYNCRLFCHKSVDGLPPCAERSFLTNQCDGESRNSVNVTETREKGPSLALCPSPPSRLAVSPTGEVSCRTSVRVRSSSRRLCRSTSSSSTSPTALAVRKRRRAPIAAATTGGSGGLPPTRPAEPHPEGRHRVCGKPQWRLNGSLSTYWFAVDGGCAELTPLYSILPATPPCGVSDGDGWRLSRSTYRIGVSR